MSCREYIAGNGVTPRDDIDYTGGIEDEAIQEQFEQMARDLKESEDEIQSIETRRSEGDNEERMQIVIKETIANMVREGELDRGLAEGWECYIPTKNLLHYYMKTTHLLSSSSMPNNLQNDHDMLTSNFSQSKIGNPKVTS